MSLTQSERIQISKKIVEIPSEIEAANSLKASIDLEVVKAQALDISNANLMNSFTPLINNYQSELAKYDGNVRTTLNEQDLIDSAKKLFRNSFFPNDINTPLPSLPNGTWINYTPFARSKAVGKTYSEGFGSTIDSELDILDDIGNIISSIESLSDATRSTGFEVIPNPFPPTYLKQTSTAMQNLATDLKNEIDTLLSMLNEIVSNIPDNTLDPNNVAENTAYTNSLNNTIAEIENWQALQDFDTVTATPSIQPDFDNTSYTIFQPSKFRSTELDALKIVLDAREVAIPNRVSFLENTLGEVVQSMSDGSISSYSGLYGNRYRFIDMRINLTGGSLVKYIALTYAGNTQTSSVNLNTSNLEAYSTFVVASPFVSPGGNSTTVHVEDASVFNINDEVYVVSNTQEELLANIVDINNNAVTLDIIIPVKYRESEGARLYKVL